MTLSHEQAKALAGFINTLRPDWDKPGIIHALGEARFRGDSAGVAIAAIRAATTAAVRTPAVIAMDGKHWDHEDTHTPVSGKRVDHVCERCGKWPESHHNGRCPTRVDAASYAEQARKAIAEARKRAQEAKP
jgi:hypothetical protein